MSDSHSRQEKAGTPDHGPTEAPPNLPRGWIAQWDAKAAKYYFVQLSTSHAQWELPTQPAPGVDTPSSTPMSGENSQFPRPVGSPDQARDKGEGTRGIGSDEGAEGERGLGTMALNMALGKQGHGNQQHQSGLGGLAQTFLSGQSQHGSSHGSSGGAGGLVGSLISSALASGNKPQNQTGGGHQSSSGYGSSNTPHSTSSSGVGGMFGGLLGGHGPHGQHGQNFGYSSGSSPAGGYSGTAPPAQYQPAQQHQQTFEPSGGNYNPGGYNGSGTQHQHNSQPQPAGQYGSGHQGSGQQGHQYSGIQRPEDPSKPFYVGGNFDDPSSGYGGSHQGQPGGHQGPPGGYPQGSGYPQGQHGNQGQQQHNQFGGPPQSYGGPSGGGFDGHGPPPPGGQGQYGQSGGYGQPSHQYPPPPPQGGGYGGQGGYGGPPRY